MADNEGGGGNLTGADLVARGIVGGGGQTDPNSKPADLSDFINQIFEKTGAVLGIITRIKVDSFFNTGMFANAKIEQAGLRTGNNIVAGVLPDTKGGILADAGGDIVKKENFGNITPADIGPASGGESMLANSSSFSDLGGLSPSAPFSGSGMDSGDIKLG